MRIPLPRMMRTWREREFEQHLSPATVRAGLAFWGFFAKRPRLYGIATAMAAWLLARAGRTRGRFSWLPFASGWTCHRDFPAPQGGTFQAQWNRERGRLARTPPPYPPPQAGEGRVGAASGAGMGGGSGRDARGPGSPP